VTCLLDTHFVVWIAGESKRLRKYPWLERYVPWTISPVSFLEIQLLTEGGKLGFDYSEFTHTLEADSRFIVGDVSLLTLTEKAVSLGWTRDPFDRLIAAHSLARRVPLCSVDSNILEHHKLIVPELR
jgi:PIN domain nuclease of toxin-antitoxin system